LNPSNILKRKDIFNTHYYGQDMLKIPEGERARITATFVVDTKQVFKVEDNAPGVRPISDKIIKSLMDYVHTFPDDTHPMGGDRLYDYTAKWLARIMDFFGEGCDVDIAKEISKTNYPATGKRLAKGIHKEVKKDKILKQ